MSSNVTEQMAAFYCLGLLDETMSDQVESELEHRLELQLWIQKYRDMIYGDDSDTSGETELTAGQRQHEAAKIWLELFREVENSAEKDVTLPSENWHRGAVFSQQHPMAREKAFAQAAASKPVPSPQYEQSSYCFSQCGRYFLIQPLIEDAAAAGILFRYGYALLVIKYADKEVVRLVIVNEVDGRFLGSFNLSQLNRVPPLSVNCYNVDDHVDQAWSKITEEAVSLARNDNGLTGTLSKHLDAIELKMNEWRSDESE